MDARMKQLLKTIHAIPEMYPHTFRANVQYAHKFHAVVEYANSKHWEEVDLSSYYQECRNKARSPNYTFVGD
jgi:hypothetical protein